MSDKLTISAALSVLMMAAYAVLGAESARVPLGPNQADLLSAPLEASAPALPSLADVLPILR